MKTVVDASQKDLPGVAAVSRALTILRAFGNDDRRLSLAEISRRTGLYKSTVLRLAESLEAFDFLVRDDRGDFRLGIENLRLGALARLSVGGADEIIAALGELMDRTGESATYYVRRDKMRLALYRVDSPRSVRDHIKAGDLLPLEYGAAGHILSSSKHVENGDETAGPRFKSIVSLGERDPDVAAVAGPVYFGNRVVGALSVSGPISRFSAAAIKTMEAAIEEKCKHLSSILRDGDAFRNSHLRA